MTVAPRLRSLAIDGFRGASTAFQMDFDQHCRMTLVYGENGTGKTTICDALEFLARDAVGSLADKGVGAQPSQYWHSIGRTPHDVRVKLVTASGTCEGTISSRKASVKPDCERPTIAIFRRQLLLDFVEAQPAKRYDAIKPFIDIDSYERSEASLRTLAKSLEADERAASAERTREYQAIHDCAEAEDHNGGDVLAWARARIAGGHDPAARLAQLRASRDAYASIRPFADRRDRCSESLRLARAEHADAATHARLAIGDGGSVTEHLVELLNAGATLLGADEPITCPLCDSTENAHGLRGRVEARLQAFARVKAALTRSTTARRATEAARAAWEALEQEYGGVRACFDAAKAGAGDPVPAAPAGLDDLPAWLEAILPFEGRVAEEEARLGEEGKFRSLLAAAVEQFDRVSAKLAQLQALRPRADAALEICVAERQAFVDGVIGGIAQRVGELYEAVHPNEGLGKISLELKKASNASVNLLAEFAGHEGPPQAYFSQSHLDTLGLCIFLALASRGNPANTILILDDMLGSVDEPHVDRVIGMIYTVAQQFHHSIVTTHYRPWREKYRWGWIKPGQPCQFVELSRWSLTRGISTTLSMPEHDALRAMLQGSPCDAQALAGKAGVILEALLDYLTLKYACRVPRRTGDTFTLGDLLPAVNAKLRAALIVEHWSVAPDGTRNRDREEPLAPYLAEVDRIASTRNVMGAHFNRLSFDMHHDDAIAFGKQVLKLADALICPDHGWPSNDRSGSYWRNSGDSRRLHPLKMPS